MNRCYLSVREGVHLVSTPRPFGIRCHKNLGAVRFGDEQIRFKDDHFFQVRVEHQPDMFFLFSFV